MNDHEHLLEQIRSIARTAGEAILEVYESDFDVETKGDRSPLTEADRVSHRIITERLAALRPAPPVLSEEAAEEERRDRFDWPRYCLVVPLDGTEECSKPTGQLPVSSA